MHIWELHAAVVHFPIAFLVGGVALDLYGRKSEATVRIASYLILAGIIAALIAAVAGIVAFYTVPPNHTAEAHDRVIWHLWTNVMAVVMFAVVGWFRWKRPEVVSPAIRGLGVVAVLVMFAGAFLGGNIVYSGGMGIEPSILKPDLRPTSNG